MLSFLSNLWVVPVISFLTVPLLFAGLLIGPALLLADFSLALALWPLPFLAQGWMVTGHIALIWIPLMWAAVYIIRLDMWRQHPLLLPGMVLSCCLYLRKTPLPEWSVTILDIGHGLAVVVIKDGRAVVYDTGNRFGSRDDGLRTVLPYLRYHRLTPDWIMISHDHRDHTRDWALCAVLILPLWSKATFRRPIHLVAAGSGGYGSHCILRCYGRMKNIR